MLEEERKRLGRRVDEEGRVWQLLEAAREEGGDETRVKEEVERAVNGAVEGRAVEGEKAVGTSGG